MQFLERRETPLVLTMVGALVLAVGSTAVLGQDAPAGASAENGRTVYRSAGCQRCHGQSGQGGEAPTLAPDPIPYADFVKIVRSGKGEMVAVDAGTLKDSDLADIYAFLKSVT